VRAEKQALRGSEIQLLWFYDFEVFEHDWLCVLSSPTEKREVVIINDPEKLERFHEEHKHHIWVGFNSRHYDSFILKGILCGFNPKLVNDHIIAKGEPGWTFSSLFRRIPLNSYDVMTGKDRGLKALEGFLGNSIRESSVPFDIGRPLTKAELDETVQYCRHDVEQTMEVFLRRAGDFEAHRGLVRLASGGRLNLSLMGLTNPQLSALILGASKHDWRDEFDIDFPSTARIGKYAAVLDWYRSAENRCYEKGGKKSSLEITVAGVPHQFGYGGVHGAIPKYHGKGFFLYMDVTSLYPSLMIRYNLGSRSMRNPARFEEIYSLRLKHKREGNPLQESMKLVLNSTYGVMKDMTNALYDPRQANRVCVYGQILLLDLIERLEPHCQLIQSNTDGVLVRGEDTDEWYSLIDGTAREWEQRTALSLEFEEYAEVYQKDVNNYIMIDRKGCFKSKGAYVKKLTPLDYDLPIINRALVGRMVRGVPLEQTIGGCDDLKEFQLVTKISGKYTCIMHGEKKLKEKCIRIFASKDASDPGVRKTHAKTGRPAKLANSPLHCFIFNGDVNGVKAPAKLDKEWYLAMAQKRLKDFGAE
jgi:DNA polymerase